MITLMSHQYISLVSLLIHSSLCPPVCHWSPLFSHLSRTSLLALNSPILYLAFPLHSVLNRLKSLGLITRLVFTSNHGLIYNAIPKLHLPSSPTLTHTFKFKNSTYMKSVPFPLNYQPITWNSRDLHKVHTYWGSKLKLALVFNFILENMFKCVLVRCGVSMTWERLQSFYGWQLPGTAFLSCDAQMYAVTNPQSNPQRSVVSKTSG
jgi:hypothetical protein